MAELKSFFDLYTSPAAQRFRVGETEQLALTLRRLDEVTSLLPVSEAAELQLDGHGRTIRGGCRLTHEAFRQLAPLLASGALAFLPELAGVTRTTKNGGDLVDGRAARHIWNNLIALRFPLLRSYRLLRNETDKLIEGVTGLAHRFLENSALFEGAATSVLRNRPGCLFHAAALLGRTLTLWFREERPFHTIPGTGDRWPLYRGFYFANGEISGQAVRGTLAVFMRRGVCLAPYTRYGRRVTHIGRKFQLRLGAMLDAVTAQEFPDALIRDGAARLVGARLGFLANPDLSRQKAQVKLLVRNLTSAGLSQGTAGEAVRLAFSLGRGAGRESTAMVLMGREVAARSLLDLLVPLCQLSRRTGHSRRERLEQIAFSILTGQLTFTGDTHGSADVEEASGSARQ